MPRSSAPWADNEAHTAQPSLFTPFYPMCVATVSRYEVKISACDSEAHSPPALVPDPTIRPVQDWPYPALWTPL